MRAPACSLWTAHAVCMLLALPNTVAGQAYLPRVEVAAGGGFAGVRVAQVGTRPAIDCPPGGQCQLLPDQVELFDDTRRVWKPALASGIVLRWRLRPWKTDTASMAARQPVDPDTLPDFGIGIGGQMVFVPSGDETRIMPAITLHAGTRNTQLFFGFLLGAFDRVEFPNAVDRIRVPTGTQGQFIERDADKRANFFVGVVVEGVSVTK